MPEKSPQEAMRDYLLGRSIGQARRNLGRIPSDPHCKLCAAPFGGIGGAILGRVGFSRFPGNPAICNNCIKGLNKVVRRTRSCISTGVNDVVASRHRTRYPPHCRP